MHITLLNIILWVDFISLNNLDYPKRNTNILIFTRYCWSNQLVVPSELHNVTPYVGCAEVFMGGKNKSLFLQAEPVT